MKNDNVSKCLITWAFERYLVTLLLGLCELNVLCCSEVLVLQCQYDSSFWGVWETHFSLRCFIPYKTPSLLALSIGSNGLLRTHYYIASLGASFFPVFCSIEVNLLGEIIRGMELGDDTQCISLWNLQIMTWYPVSTEMGWVRDIKMKLNPSKMKYIGSHKDRFPLFWIRSNFILFFFVAVKSSEVKNNFCRLWLK